MSFLGTLLDTNQRFDIPQDEKRDVQQELLKTFLSGVSRRDLIDGGAINMLADHLRSTENAMAAKAVILAPAVLRRPYPTETLPEGRPGHQAVLKVNEFGLIGSVTGERFAEKPYAQGGFDFLYQIAQAIDLVQAIIYTRIRRAQRFLRLYRENDPDPLGYRFLRQDHERLTKDDQKEVRRLDRILQHSGDEDHVPTRFFRRHRQNLLGFVTQMLASSLTADACPFETERANNGSLRGWYALDYRTIRLAFEDGYDGDDQIVAVQIHPESRLPFLGFREDEIVYPIRNPRADITYQGYGQAELENLVRCLTAYLNSCALNAAQQSNNTIPRGILTLFGDYDQRQLNFFRNEMNAFMSGATNRFKVPVMTARNKTEGGAGWTPIDTTANEMMMKSWILLQASLACAVYGIDPVEINFDAFTQKTSSLSGDNTKERMQSSHDVGFTSLMRNVETWVNENIVAELNPKYAITLVGLYPEDEQAKHERQALCLTLNEMREIDGEVPIKDADLGDCPLNPNLIPIYQMKMTHQLRQDAIASGEDPTLYGGALPLLPDVADGDSPRPSGGPSSAGSRGSASGRSGDGRSAGPSRSERATRQTRKANAAEPPKLVVEIRRLTAADVELEEAHR